MKFRKFLFIIFIFVIILIILVYIFYEPIKIIERKEYEKKCPKCFPIEYNCNCEPCESYDNKNGVVIPLEYYKKLRGLQNNIPEKGDKPSSMLGIKNRWNFGPGTSMLALSYADHIIFEYVFSELPDYCGMIEIGSASGISSLWFSLIMKIRGCKFYGVDYKEQRSSISKNNWFSNADYLIENVLKNVNEKVVGKIKEVDFIFLDNGDKYKEFEMYYKYVKPGSIIFVHQRTSKYYKFLKRFINKGEIEYFAREFSDAIGSNLVALKKL
jgi:hypothetical protein